MNQCSARTLKNSEKELEIYIPPGPRLGDIVIEADNVSKAYGDKHLNGRYDVFTSSRRV